MHTYSSGGSITQGTPIRDRSFLYLRSTDYPSGLNPFLQHMQDLKSCKPWFIHRISLLTSTGTFIIVSLLLTYIMDFHAIIIINYHTFIKHAIRHINSLLKVIRTYLVLVSVLRLGYSETFRFLRSTSRICSSESISIKLDY